MDSYDDEYEYDYGRKFIDIDALNKESCVANTTRPQNKPTENEQLVVSNAVCMAKLHNVPTIAQLACIFYGHYDKKEFAAAIRCRLANPRCTVLIFNTGNMLANSVTSLAMGMACFTAVLYRLVAHGYHNVYFSNARSVQYASTYYLRHSLDMARVVEKFVDISLWEDNFAGGTLHIPGEGGTAVLLFRSGRLVITGARNPGGLVRSVDWVVRVSASCAPQDT